MHKLTNIAKGPRGWNGLDTIAPGESVEVELSDEALAYLESTGWFEIEKAKGKPGRKPKVEGESGESASESAPEQDGLEVA
jgi:hypothetical protein